MRKMKYVIGILLLFMVIGFATVSVSLSISGNAKILSDVDDFKVYFSDVYVNGKRNWTIVESETSIVFDVKLVDVGSEQVVSYDVTNASRIFDAALSINCTQGDEGLSIVNEFDASNLPALSTRTGVLTIRKVKSNASETDTKYEITCNIVASPLSRSEEASGEVIPPIQSSPTILMASSYSDTTAFRSSTYKEKIQTITFEDEINVPQEAVESWDIGVAQNGNVMAYVTTNETDSTYYDLYIQSNSQLYANKNMSYWFANLKNVDSINGLELLDTSMTTDMSYMFQNTGYNSTTFTLDVSNFDTSGVTNMSYMFYYTGYKSTVFTLDVSNFHTSKVEKMGSMFLSAGYSSPTFTLDVSNFDTSKVTDMSSLFYYAGYNSTVFTLDVSNFDTSSVTNMSAMFAFSGYKNPTFTLDVSSFDTSNVTNMSSTFWSTGYSNPSFTLNLSNFDTSNVTTMRNMFNETGYKSKIFTLDISHFDTSKVTDMYRMFYYTGYSSTIFTLDVSNFDTSQVTGMIQMFSGTGHESTKLQTSITIMNPNITTYSSMFVGVATKTGSKITVNYTNETSDLVDLMIATKSVNSNVVKGYNVSKVISFDIGGTLYSAYQGMTYGQWVDSAFNTGGFRIVDYLLADSSGNIIEINSGLWDPETRTYVYITYGVDEVIERGAPIEDEIPIF